ncbi:TonB-dependent receptor [Sphingopyxis sp.]|uniref:TonB-dependent receptor n=1 Tax=Sphingopyxis sp. TaxID=1908224 RepID=UPI0035B3ED53
MKFRHTLAASAALIPVALLSTPAFAQSTGSVDFENDIVVTGSRATDVAGIQSPDTSKAKSVLGQEIIGRQAPGQTVNDIINLVPGVSFQNNDPFGSAGGKMSIRGFDNTRISQTFDGIPLNDSGNYALYSNQQLDPELIEQVNVNLGSTDVDSPTAAASGSTVNYRTRNPSEDFGVKLVGSAGDFNFFRVFGMVDTGNFTPWGTRLFVSASSATNRTVFGSEDIGGVLAHKGKISKQQYNAKLYQPIGDNGDFVSVSGHYNQNRNNFFGSVALRNDRAAPSGFPLTRDDRDYVIARCQIPAARAGVADSTNSCGSSFDERYNPSNTGNIRVNSRFTLSDGLVLTVDPSYQYTKANGGGTLIASEGFTTIGGQPRTGYIGASSSSATQFYAGRDLNGDGDTLDLVRVLAPSQTQTNRYGVIASLRYDINDFHTVRVAYSLDRARHRQTGPAGFLQLDGRPFDVFPINDPITDGVGNILQKRDRKSLAILNQVSGEYRGEFGALTVSAGVRAPFFKRDLNNYCFTKDASGVLNCFGTNTTAAAAYATANPTVQGPQRRVLKYDRILPNLGLVYDITPQASVFANYSKGIQVPGTDNLYNSFFFDPTSEQANPKPETTDNFDLGVRYRSGKIQAQLSGWYTNYTNRLASSYDPETDRNVYRNLGKVTKYGIDGSIAYSPISEVSLYLFGSYLKSKIKDDVQVGICSTATAANTSIALGCTAAQTAANTPIFAPTAGKRESGSPVYTFGGRVNGRIGPVELGVQAKRTGPRYVYDTNLPIFTVSSATGANATQVYGAKAPAYTLVDLDARVSLEWAGLNDKTYLQFNVLNVFDKVYVGGFDGALGQIRSYNGTTFSTTSPPFVQIGSPRTFIGSLVVGF